MSVVRFTSLASALSALAPDVPMPERDTALASLAAFRWPRAIRYTVGDREITWAGHRLPTRHGDIWCIAQLSEQFFVLATVDDTSNDPQVFVVDHDELEDRSNGQPLSRWLLTVRAAPLVAADGVTFESASVDDARVLLRTRGSTADSDERSRLVAMAKRYGLGEIAELRLEWGDTELSDLLTDERLWSRLFSSAESRGRFLEAETTVALRSSDERLRLRAIAHLGRQGSRGAELLVPLTKDRAPGIAVAATKALTHCAGTTDRTVLEGLVKDKRADVASAALIALVASIGADAADAVAEAVTRRPAEMSFALLVASGYRFAGAVDVEAATLTDVVARAARPTTKNNETRIEITCDLGSREGRLRAQIPRTFQAGKPLPEPIQRVILHLVRTLGVAVVAKDPRTVGVVEGPEGAAAWKARLLAEGRTLIAR